MNDDRCYIADLEKRVVKQKRRIKELKREVEELEEELRTVVDREHAIHNEAAAGMIDRIKELEKQIFDWKGVVDRQEATLQLRQNLINDREGQIAKLQKALDLAANNEQVRMKQLAERELVIIQKDERIGALQKVNSELFQRCCKLQQDLEYDKQMLAQYEEAIGDRPTSLERDITRALNYWGADSNLETADFILADFLMGQLLSLKDVKTAEKAHGIPPTRVTFTGPVTDLSDPDPNPITKQQIDAQYGTDLVE